jgi:16S rRNA (guanine966-N2)-methyltransferase
VTGRSGRRERGELRVIAGELRGRKLRAPEGGSTRPTSDRVREALFNLIGPVPEGGRVLDLYAGSGALGIEALSRGAGRAVFVETDPRARLVIQDNLRALGLEARGRVEGVDAAGAAAFAGGPFDLVLADPPYGEADLGLLLARAARAMAAGGVLAVERAAAGGGTPEPPETLALWKDRRYGSTRLTLYVRQEGAD